MDRLEELIKELPREIQQNFVNILEFIIQKRARQIKSAAKPEQPKPIAPPPIHYGPSEKSKAIGQARADFLKLYNGARRGAGLGRKMAAGADFIKTYKLRAWPELYAVLKHKVSLSTAARWATVIGESGDPLDLMPKHGEHRIGKTKRTAEQERCLREAALLHPKRYKTEVVRAARKMMVEQGVRDNCHEATYLRYLKQYVSFILRSVEAGPRKRKGIERTKCYLKISVEWAWSTIHRPEARAAFFLSGSIRLLSQNSLF